MQIDFLSELLSVLRPSVLQEKGYFSFRFFVSQPSADFVLEEPKLEFEVANYDLFVGLEVEDSAHLRFFFDLEVSVEEGGLGFREKRKDLLLVELFVSGENFSAKVEEGLVEAVEVDRFELYGDLVYVEVQNGVVALLDQAPLVFVVENASALFSLFEL